MTADRRRVSEFLTEDTAVLAERLIGALIPGYSMAVLSACALASQLQARGRSRISPPLPRPTAVWGGRNDHPINGKSLLGLTRLLMERADSGLLTPRVPTKFREAWQAILSGVSRKEP